MVLVHDWCHEIGIIILKDVSTTFISLIPCCRYIFTRDTQDIKIRLLNIRLSNKVRIIPNKHQIMHIAMITFIESLTVIMDVPSLISPNKVTRKETK